MIKQQGEDGTTAALWCLLALTVLLGVLPFAIYAWSRAAGVLPSEAEWSTRGGNHGPWRDQWHGLFILFAGLLLRPLVAITLIVSAVCSLVLRKVGPIMAGIALAALQRILFEAWARYLFWTVD